MQPHACPIIHGRRRGAEEGKVDAVTQHGGTTARPSPEECSGKSQQSTDDDPKHL